MQRSMSEGASVSTVLQPARGGKRGGARWRRDCCCWGGNL